MVLFTAFKLALYLPNTISIDSNDLKHHIIKLKACFDLDGRYVSGDNVSFPWNHYFSVLTRLFAASYSF